MKITSSRKDDILKRKAEYEQSRDAWRADRESRKQNYYRAIDSQSRPIEEAVMEQLRRFPSLEFEVRADEANYGGRGYKIAIQCNEQRKFSEDSALSWSYDVHISKDGEVKRESSSWSGLQACTESQLNSLKQTVAAIELLYNMDWASLLDKPHIRYEDYFGDMPDEPKAPSDFDRELVEAEVEDIIGTNKIIKVQGWESCPIRERTLWVQIISETPSQYKCKMISDFTKRRYSTQGGLDMWLEDAVEYRVRKTSLRPVQPLQVEEI